MTVRQMIDILEKCDPDSDVITCDHMDVYVLNLGGCVAVTDENPQQ